MGKMRFDNLKPLRFWGFSMVFLMWVSMGKAKRFELLFPEEKVGFFGHDLGTFQVVQVKYDLILSNFSFLGFMENI